MELVTVTGNLIFWMFLSFGIVLLILKKFAWKPILKALKDREDSIDNALKSAENAKEEMAKLKADNEKIINEAKLERDSIIKEAKEAAMGIVNDSKSKAVDEANKIVENARLAVEAEKKQAIDEIKNQIAIISLDIAEKVLREKLDNDKSQKDFVDKLVNNVKLS